MFAIYRVHTTTYYILHLLFKLQFYVSTIGVNNNNNIGLWTHKIDALSWIALSATLLTSIVHYEDSPCAEAVLDWLDEVVMRGQFSFSWPASLCDCVPACWPLTMLSRSQIKAKSLVPHSAEAKGPAKTVVSPGE